MRDCCWVGGLRQVGCVWDGSEPHEAMGFCICSDDRVRFISLGWGDEGLSVGHAHRLRAMVEGVVWRLCIDWVV